jgi:glycogen synthase
MTGLVPAAANARNIPSLFTLHNIHSDRETLSNLEANGIDVSRFWHDLYLEEHPDTVKDPWRSVGVDFLLSGIKASSFVNTVSPSFLVEIVNGYYPDLITPRVREEIRAKYNVGCAAGILNAPKANVNPRTARGLVTNYGETNVCEGKKANKASVQAEMVLEINPDAPLFFWPHRLFAQKGPVLLEQIALSLVRHYWADGLQIAIVGNGDTHWEEAFGAISCGSGGRIAYRHFEPMLSERAKAGADFILMPSLYEPCGLPQMEGMRYGTLPVVRATGGLRDTVQHLSEDGESGNGFVFEDFVPDALWWACSQAMGFHRRPEDWKRRVLRRVMKEARENFNLEKTTLAYVGIYERLLGERLL